ncbi:LmeA family phospholipid-binding protein [Mycobacterium neglectum]|jgi:hypothetical protein|uniref:LmeA family phospholipid-binding protein n=1 Tax=Mycobacterium neglectum TaxID=242737 RepID=UPI000BFEAB03|nr:LmeA family phospholipid-binding protein [Mycobacterium neglectum]
MTYPMYAQNTLHTAPTQAFHTAPTQTFHTLPTQAWSSQVAPPAPPAPPQPITKRKRSRGPVTLLLVTVIVLTIAAGGLLGAELYARTVAVDKIKSATACFIEASEDSVDVSFETSPPVLMQYFNDSYTGFTITTNGSHILSAEGMTANIAVDDVETKGGVNGQGTVGAIDATVDWTNEGMRKSANTALKEAIDEYLEGSFLSFLGDWISTDDVVTGIRTDPSTGIVTLAGMFDSSIAVKPETTADGGIKLEIQPDGFTLGGDLDLPAEDLQSKLDEMTSELTDNEYNLRADSLEVTDSGVTAEFSASDIDIPASDGAGGCFEM